MDPLATHALWYPQAPLPRQPPRGAQPRAQTPRLLPGTQQKETEEERAEGEAAEKEGMAGENEGVWVEVDVQEAEGRRMWQCKWKASGMGSSSCSERLSASSSPKKRWSTCEAFTAVARRRVMR